MNYIQFVRYLCLWIGVFGTLQTIYERDLSGMLILSCFWSVTIFVMYYGSKRIDSERENWSKYSYDKHKGVCPFCSSYMIIDNFKMGKEKIKIRIHKCPNDDYEYREARDRRGNIVDIW